MWLTRLSVFKLKVNVNIHWGGGGTMFKWSRVSVEIPYEGFFEIVVFILFVILITKLLKGMFCNVQ